jgi:hypothetical protein
MGNVVDALLTRPHVTDSSTNDYETAVAQYSQAVHGDRDAHDVLTSSQGRDEHDGNSRCISVASLGATTGIQVVQNSPCVTSSHQHLTEAVSVSRVPQLTGEPTPPVQHVIDLDSRNSRLDATVHGRQASRDHFDIFMIYHSRDEQRVNKLKDILFHFVCLPDGEKLTFCLEDIDHPYIANQLRYFEESLNRSRYKFIFLSEEITDSCGEMDEHQRHEDRWMTFQHHQALTTMIEQGDESIVPVIAGRNVKVPPLLRLYHKLDVKKLLRNKSLDDIDNVYEAEVDTFMIHRIVSMFTKQNSTVPIQLTAVQPISANQLLVKSAESKDNSSCSSSRLGTSQLTPKRYKYLVEKLDPDHGLLLELYATEIINQWEMESVKACRTSFDRNEYLLTLLQKKSDDVFKKFLDALSRQGMAHIVKHLRTIY